MHKRLIPAAVLFTGTTVASAQVVGASKMDTEGGLLGTIISEAHQSHDITVFGVPALKRVI
jgi:glycine betaine/choline ABC-type transport system substrate-binding protein